MVPNRILETARTAAVSLVFLAASATAVEHSIVKVSLVIGGVLQITIQVTLTITICLTTMMTLPVLTKLRNVGFQFVASGIELTLSSPPKLCEGGAKGAQYPKVFLS
jgi:hypothetical protein